MGPVPIKGFFKAKKYFKNNPQKVKYRTKQALNHFFIHFGQNKIIAVSEKQQCIAIGNKEEFRSCTNEKGERFSLRITSEALTDNEYRIMESLDSLKGFVQQPPRISEKGSFIPGKFYYLVEHKPGKILREILEDALDPKNFLTKKTKLIILLQCCLAILNLHKKGILHNNIKPDNFIVQIVEKKIISVSEIDYQLSQILPEGIGFLPYAPDVYALGNLMQCLKIMGFENMINPDPSQRPSLPQVISKLLNDLKTHSLNLNEKLMMSVAFDLSQDPIHLGRILYTGLPPIDSNALYLRKEIFGIDFKNLCEYMKIYLTKLPRRLIVLESSLSSDGHLDDLTTRTRSLEILSVGFPIVHDDLYNRFLMRQNIPLNDPAKIHSLLLLYPGISKTLISDPNNEALIGSIRVRNAEIFKIILNQYPEDQIVKKILENNYQLIDEAVTCNFFNEVMNVLFKFSTKINFIEILNHFLSFYSNLEVRQFVKKMEGDFVSTLFNEPTPLLLSDSVDVRNDLNPQLNSPPETRNERLMNF